MNAPLKCPSTLERAEGKLEIHVHNIGYGNALVRLFQDGCLKARFPKMHDEGPKRGVLINTSGGIADGDSLTTHINVAAQSELALTTQAAERIYRARHRDSPAIMETRLDIGEQGTLYWLPQETILFDGAAIHRRFDLNVAKSGTFIGAEMMVLGRTAMQEQVQHCNLFDRWRIHIDGTLAFADGFRLEGSLLEKANGPAQLAGNITYATLFIVGSHAVRTQQPLREIIDRQSAVTAGCSLRGQVLICRFAAVEAKALSSLLSTLISTADQTIHGTQRVTQAILPRWIF